MTRYRVKIIGFRETRPLIVEAESIQQASRKVKEKLGLDFAQYFIEEGSSHD